MADPWIERVDGGVLEIELEGFDANKQDELETQAAVEAMVEDGGPTPKDDFFKRWFFRTSNLAGMMIATGFVLGLLAITALNHFFPNLDDSGAGMLVEFLTFVAAFGVPIAVAARILRRKPQELSFATERFSIRLDASSLTFEGTTSPKQKLALADIAEVEARRERLAIVKADGTKVPIAMSMLAAQHHPELATRLNDAIRGTRARVADYRGQRVVLQQEERVEELEANESEEKRLERW